MAVLITGASSGLGTAFARRFAQEGNDVVLVARRRERLDQLAKEVENAHRVRATVIAMDLTTPTAAKDLYDEVAAQGIQVDTLVNNAGFATQQDLLDSDPDRIAQEIQLNCAALVQLTMRFLPAMVQRGQGAVINLSSAAAFAALPHMAVYAATKSFVLFFSEALHAEVRHSGVTVTAICPGPTDTEFWDVAGSSGFGMRMRTAPQVVQSTMRGLRKRKAVVTDGLLSALQAQIPRLLPRRLMTAAAERAMRP